MRDDEELLEPSGPRLPRRLRLGAIVAIVLAVAALIAVRVWPRSSPHHAATPSTSVLPAPTTEPQSTTTPANALRPWPTAPAACGGQAELPIVSSVPVRERTGIEVVVGAGRMSRVNFDTGHLTPLPKVQLRQHEFVVDVLGTSPTYALAEICTATGPDNAYRLLHIGADGDATAISLSGEFPTVLTDRGGAWLATLPDDKHANGSLAPIDGGRRVQLPADFSPVALTDGVLIGAVGSIATVDETVLLVDAATGRTRANLGAGVPVAAANGVVVWSVGCDVSILQPCRVYTRSINSGPTKRYILPRPPGFGPVAMSADGRVLAFSLERKAPDAHYDQGHPLPPTDVAVLNLDSGTLDVVPGVETAAKTPAAVAFSSDGRWLVIALNAGTQTRLLAWRPGLAHPYESRPAPGLVLQPAVTVLP